MAAGAKVLVELRNYISSGTYPPQSRLPAERELAAELGVTRTTLRNALATLEAEGKVWRQVGRGTFVGRRPVDSTDNLTLPADRTNPSEVMEVRLILEPRMAASAAVRATAADIAFMYRCLRKAASARDLATFELWDSSLHRTIAESTRNGLLIALYTAIDSVREHRIWGKMKERAVTDDRKNRYGRQHHEIVDAIQSRDADGAERTMRRHLETVRQDLMANSL